MTGARRAVFLDRDGVLVRERGAITRPEELEILPGVAEALARLRRAGFLLLVATNQGAIARGLLTEDALALLHDTLARRLRDAHPEAGWDALYYCPHHPTEGRPPYGIPCTCRKPFPGMLLRGISEHGLDPNVSWMVGDAARDLEAGRAAGCRTLALPGPDGRFAPGADVRAPGLLEAAHLLVP